MTMTKEEEIIFKFANSRPYGIYCDIEVSPLDPDYCSDYKALRWDDSTTKDIDEIHEWLCEYYEDDEEKLDLLIPFKDLNEESKKWQFIEDLDLWHDIIPDDMSFYYYGMDSRMVGLCFTWNEALRLKNLIDPSLKPHIEILSRGDIKGYHELAEISDYFREKAKEIF